MQQDIHPEYTPATIVCSCGNEIETRSTQEEIHVEICSVCHPFYTGRQKLVDTAGRVERFKRKYGDTSTGGDDEDGDAGEQADEAAADGGSDAAAEGAVPEGKPEAAADTAEPSEAGSGPAPPRKMGAEQSGPEEDEERESEAEAAAASADEPASPEEE